MTDADIDKDALVRLFFEESDEGLAALEQALLTLEGARTTKTRSRPRSASRIH